MSIVTELGELLKTVSEDGPPVLDDRRAYSALRRALRAVHPMVASWEVAVDVVIDAIDRDVSAVVDAILHHPKMRDLESIWRAARFVVDRVDFRENTKCEILNCSKEDLLADFEDSPEVPKSGLYKLVYSAEFGPFGGRAYGAMIANYTFGGGPRDAALLAKCASVGGMAALPFVTGFTPLPEELSPTAPALAQRNAVRETPDARFLAGAWQRVSGRPPHASAWKNGLRFEETVRDRLDRVWINACSVVAVAAARSFAKWRLACDLDASVEGAELDVPWTPALDARLEGHGAMALTEHEGVRLVSHRTFLSPQAERHAGMGGAPLTDAEAAVHGDLHGVFAAGRLVHYIKTLQREQIGSWKERPVLEAELLHWLQQFVPRALEGAKLRVLDVEGCAGWYRFDIKFRAAWGHTPCTMWMAGKLDKE